MACFEGAEGIAGASENINPSVWRTMEASESPLYKPILSTGVRSVHCVCVYVSICLRVCVAGEGSVGSPVSVFPTSPQQS